MGVIKQKNTVDVTDWIFRSLFWNLAEGVVNGENWTMTASLQTVIAVDRHLWRNFFAHNSFIKSGTGLKHAGFIGTPNLMNENKSKSKSGSIVEHLFEEHTTFEPLVTMHKFYGILVN